MTWVDAVTAAHDVSCLAQPIRHWRELTRSHAHNVEPRGFVCAMAPPPLRDRQREAPGKVDYAGRR